MTRKKFIKTLMGRGMSRNDAIKEAKYVIGMSESISIVNHEWKVEESTPEGILKRTSKMVLGHRLHLCGYADCFLYVEAALMQVLEKTKK